MSKQRVVLWGGVVVIGILVAGSVFVALNRHDVQRSLERASLPAETNYHDLVPANTVAASPAQKVQVTPQPSTAAAQTSAKNMPVEINLAIPFTSQAPFGSWQNPYKEFCEEASILMAVRYLKNQPIRSTTDASDGMLAIQAFEQKEFGYWEDTTAAEVATILQKHFGISAVKVKINPTVDDIKAALAAGKPVIMPAAGRLLGNPFYTPPGPLYHMLVIKGYTKTGQFITNDPGTRRGADFLYSPTTIMNALHDWRPDGNVEAGRKVILIVG